LAMLRENFARKGLPIHSMGFDELWDRT